MLSENISTTPKKQGAGVGCRTRLYINPESPITALNNAAGKGRPVLMHDPVEDMSHSNHNRDGKHTPETRILQIILNSRPMSRIV